MDELKSICEPCAEEIRIEPDIDDKKLEPLCNPCTTEEEDSFIIPKPELVETIRKGKTQDDIVNLFLNEKRCRII